MAERTADSLTNKNRPRLRTLEPTVGERHASWLELFFDLVFVLAVAQVARTLSGHTDLPGLLKYAALFFAVWWSWVGYTFYADRFETEHAGHRILTFAGMLAVAGLSVTLGGAFTPEGDRAFVICYILVRLVLIALYLRAAYYIPLARAFTLQYPLGFGISSSLLLLSLLSDPPTRYAIWALALLVDVATPLLNLRAARILPIDRSHIPERFGLFTIIVLGEAVMATAMGAAGVAWTPATIGTACFGFAMAAAIWWITFDFVEDSAIRSDSILQRFVYIYSHFFIVAGIVAIGIGVEHAIKETVETHLHFSTIALIVGGALTYLTSITITRLITGVCNLIFPRVIAIALLLTLLFLGPILTPLAFVGLSLLLLSAQVWLESYLSSGETAEDFPHLARRASTQAK